MNRNKTQELKYLDELIQNLRSIELELVEADRLRADFSRALTNRKHTFLISFAIFFFGVFYIFAYEISYFNGFIQNFNDKMRWGFGIAFFAWLFSVILYFILNNIWNHSKRIQKTSMRMLFPSFQARKIAVNLSLYQLVNGLIGRQTRVDSAYLNIKTLGLIRRYLQNNQASTIEEAVFMYDFDRTNDEQSIVFLGGSQKSHFYSDNHKPYEDALKEIKTDLGA
jgi:uncharacterized membrane protein (DUF485 family)